MKTIEKDTYDIWFHYGCYGGLDGSCGDEIIDAKDAYEAIRKFRRKHPHWYIDAIEENGEEIDLEPFEDEEPDWAEY